MAQSQVAEGSPGRMLQPHNPEHTLFEHLCCALSWDSVSYHVLGEAQKGDTEHENNSKAH